MEGEGQTDIENQTQTKSNFRKWWDKTAGDLVAINIIEIIIAIISITLGAMYPITSPTYYHILNQDEMHKSDCINFTLYIYIFNTFRILINIYALRFAYRPPHSCALCLEMLSIIIPPIMCFAFMAQSFSKYKTTVATSDGREFTDRSCFYYLFETNLITFINIYVIMQIEFIISTTGFAAVGVGVVCFFAGIILLKCGKCIWELLQYCGKEIKNCIFCADVE